VLRPHQHRLLLLLPTATYRTAAFVEAARHLGVDLTVASERPSTFQDANPGGLVTLDFSDPERAAAQARAFARDHPLQGVVGVDDDTAVVAAAIAGALGLRGNGVVAARAARDKHEQRTLLAAAGVPVPGFALHRIDEDARQLAAGVSYPCVLKPLRLAASRGVIRADTAGAFVAAFERVKRILEHADSRSLLIEDFVPGREYALEGLLLAGELHVLALFDKPDPLDGPYFEETIYVTPSRLPADDQRAVAACAGRAAAALGLREGPVHRGQRAALVPPERGHADPHARAVLQVGHPGDPVRAGVPVDLRARRRQGAREDLRRADRPGHQHVGVGQDLPRRAGRTTCRRGRSGRPRFAGPRTEATR